MSRQNTFYFHVCPTLITRTQIRTDIPVIRLKAYNETNDRYYTKTNLTTQGVGIMYKKDFNKWSDLYFWNKWRLRNKRKREEAEKVKPQQTDSITDKTDKSAVKRKRVQEQ